MFRVPEGTWEVVAHALAAGADQLSLSAAQKALNQVRAAASCHKVHPCSCRTLHTVNASKHHEEATPACKSCLQWVHMHDSPNGCGAVAAEAAAALGGCQLDCVCRA